jgi:hypothetical protein
MRFSPATDVDESAGPLDGAARRVNACAPANRRRALDVERSQKFYGDETRRSAVAD